MKWAFAVFLAQLQKRVVSTVEMTKFWIHSIQASKIAAKESIHLTFSWDYSIITQWSLNVAVSNYFIILYNFPITFLLHQSISFSTIFWKVKSIKFQKTYWNQIWRQQKIQWETKRNQKTPYARKWIKSKKIIQAWRWIPIQQISVARMTHFAGECFLFNLHLNGMNLELFLKPRYGSPKVQSDVKCFQFGVEFFWFGEKKKS